MRFILILLLSLSVICSSAQNCTNLALMKKGTKLEYIVKGPGYVDGKVLKLVFEVVNVTQSAGNTYSTIIKKGIGIKDPQKDHYQRKIKLQCDGKNLLLPFDFYETDTTYLNDSYLSSVIKKNYFLSARAPLENVNYVIPLQLEGLTSLGEGVKQVKQKAKVVAMGAFPGYMPVKGQTDLWAKEYEIVYTIKDIKMAGRQQITTGAGTFDCYAIVIDRKVQFDGKSPASTVTMYFNKEVGLVKYEIAQGKDKAASIELTGIKK